MSNEMTLPEGRKPTQKAIRECAEAMVEMLRIGWRKEDLELTNGSVRDEQ